MLAPRCRAAPEDALAGWEIVDAFMAAARQGNFTPTSPSRLDGYGVCNFAPRTTCSSGYNAARVEAHGNDHRFMGVQAVSGTVFRFRRKKSAIALQESLIALAPARISSVARLRLWGGGTNITLAMVTNPAPTAESTPGTESSMATAWVAPDIQDVTAQAIHGGVRLAGRRRQ